LEEEIKKIDAELENSLEKESANIQTELILMKKETTMLDLTLKDLLTQKEETEARFKINQINRKEYNEKKKSYAQKESRLETEISSNKTRIGKLEVRLTSISNTLEHI
jgi:hypothetical protein